MNVSTVDTVGNPREPLVGGMPVTSPVNEPVTEPVTPSIPQAETPTDPSGTDESAWVVHKLTQSRQVQTNKYEYFDGPTIAVLAFVTRIDPLSAEEQLAEEALATEAEDVQR